MGELSYHEKKVGIIFGFLRQVLKFAKRYGTNNFIFCWDSQESLRKKVYRPYKENRNKKDRTDEERHDDSLAYDQFTIIKEEILPTIGFKNIFEEDGFESDDLIAKIIKDRAASDFVIVTSDNDMYQLLDDERIIIYDLRNKREYIDEDFQLEYGILPRQWSSVKALAGCTTDNVEGIKGVGVPTAIKYYRQELNPKSKVHQRIESEDGQCIYKRNMELVKLPYKGTPILVFSKDNLKLERFESICIKYGFSSYLKKENFNEWRRSLELK